MALSIDEITAYARRLDASALAVADGDYYRFTFQQKSRAEQLYKGARNEWPGTVTYEELDDGAVVSFKTTL